MEAYPRGKSENQGLPWLFFQSRKSLRGYTINMYADPFYFPCLLLSRLPNLNRSRKTSIGGGRGTPGALRTSKEFAVSSCCFPEFEDYLGYTCRIAFFRSDSALLLQLKRSNAGALVSATLLIILPNLFFALRSGLFFSDLGNDFSVHL